MANLGLTKFGISFDVYDPTEMDRVATKTISGLNFHASASGDIDTFDNDDIIAQTTLFMRGGTSEGHTFLGLADVIEAGGHVVRNIQITRANELRE